MAKHGLDGVSVPWCFFGYSSQNARINLAWKDQTDLGNREDDKKIGAVNGGDTYLEHRSQPNYTCVCATMF